MLKRCLFRTTTRCLLAAAAVTLSGVTATAQALPLLSATLVHAQQAARASGRRGVALLILARHRYPELSLRTESIVAHDPAVRFAMRDYELVELKPARDGSYRVVGLRAGCDGVTACAEDMFLDRSFSVRQLRGLDGDAGKLPEVLVFDTRDALPVATAYGISNRSEALAFAARLGSATPTHPVTEYGDSLLDD